jgi:hypothetical protein
MWVNRQAIICMPHMRASRVFTENRRFNVCRNYLEPLAQTHAKAQAVEQRAGGENVFMAGQLACQIGKRPASIEICKRQQRTISR